MQFITSYVKSLLSNSNISCMYVEFIPKLSCDTLNNYTSAFLCVTNQKKISSKAYTNLDSKSELAMIPSIFECIARDNKLDNKQDTTKNDIKTCLGTILH